MSNSLIPEPPSPDPAGHEKPRDCPILFYDSDCGFCNRSIRFILDHEQESTLCFAPLLGTTAAAAGVPADLGMKSLVLLEAGALFVRTRAVRRILYHMGGRWRSLGKGLSLVPAPLGDVGYRFIALVRRSLPGAQSCGLLTPEQKARFLD